MGFAKDKPEAEDLTQDVFLKLFVKLASFKGKSKFSTWLYRITYNNCISEVRKRKIHFASTDDVEIKDETTELNLGGVPERC